MARQGRPAKACGDGCGVPEGLVRQEEGAGKATHDIVVRERDLEQRGPREAHGRVLQRGGSSGRL